MSQVPREDARPSPRAPPTLLRSLAVTPSSSRQGSLCTNASIWYLALMNSDLMGLGGHTGAAGRAGEASHPATPWFHVPGHAAPATALQPNSLDFVLGVGFAPAALHLRGIQQGMLPDGVGPVAGERVHHLQGRDAKCGCPLRASYCGGHRHALATAGMAGDRTEGASRVPAASTPPPHPVGPPEHVGPV